MQTHIYISYQFNYLQLGQKAILVEKVHFLSYVIYLFLECLHTICVLLFRRCLRLRSCASSTSSGVSYLIKRCASARVHSPATRSTLSPRIIRDERRSETVQLRQRVRVAFTKCVFQIPHSHPCVGPLLLPLPLLFISLLLSDYAFNPQLGGAERTDQKR